MQDLFGLLVIEKSDFSSLQPVAEVPALTSNGCIVEMAELGEKADTGDIDNESDDDISTDSSSWGSPSLSPTSFHERMALLLKTNENIDEQNAPSKTTTDVCRRLFD